MTSNIHEKSIRGNLETIVLSIINSKKRSYGYEIIQLVKNKFRVYFGPSTIYPLLNNLEKEGFIIGAWEFPLKNNKSTKILSRPRKVYVITDQGKHRLKAGALSIVSIAAVLPDNLSVFPEERPKTL